MLKNYLKIALRTLRKDTAYSLINIVGLGVGLACCLLIVLYVRYELSYDRFHEQADDVYRIAWITENPQTRTPHPMAQALVRDFPEVKHAVSLTPLWGPGLTRPTYSVRYQDRRFDERDILAVDSTFLDVFSFGVVRGDAEAALREPFAILITQAMAEKYFGDDDPLGQPLTINEEAELTVAAVLENVPPNAHFHFDFLISYVTLKQLWQGGSFFEWEDFGHYNYIRLADGTNPTAVEAQLPAWIARYLDVSPEDIESLNQGRIGFRLQRLTDIHLHSNLKWELEPNGNVAYIYLFSAAALFTLLIACVNFMNLATARSARRAKEVGVRKSLGAHRGQLAGQFLGESLLFSTLAVVGALLLIELVLPAFNNLAGTELSFYDISSGTLIAGLIGIMLLTGLIAGSYPAFFLSSFQPSDVLRGQRISGSKGALLRKGLVVFQFGISIALIAGTLTIFYQLDFLKSKSLGFQSEQVVVLPLKNNDMQSRSESIKDELLRHPDVLSASAVSNVPGGRFNQNAIQWQDAPEVDAAELRVDYDFFETLGIEMVAGRRFARDFPSDVGSALILNEAAVRQFEWTSAIGEDITWYDDDTTWVAPVIGVAKNFHHASLHQRIAPMIIQVWPDELNYMLVKIRPERVSSTIDFIEETWTAFAPDNTFEYSFLDEDFAALYQAEERMGTIVGIFSVLGTLIACLGLFGLAAFTAEQRTKEIGIRKVLGASVANVVTLLSKDFLKLVLIGFIVAAPIAYVAMQRWLEDFAYRIDLSWTIFFAAGLTALVIALLTVSYQALKAALADPVESLRYE